jgi:lipoate-protein ligase A
MWMDNWVLNKPIEAWPNLRNSAGLSCPYLIRAFESKRTCVVLSSSNQANSEVNLEFCSTHRIPILRRRGGGGTVVLGPGCQILTLAFFARSPFNNEEYFRCINGSWIQAIFESVGVLLSQRGISDLAYGDKKIAGTSLFRRKHMVVFQGSLLVDPDLEMIGQCLKHPTREPDYRMGRDHSEFVSSLKNLGVTLSAEELSNQVQKKLPEILKEKLRDHAIEGWQDNFDLPKETHILV